MNILSFGEHMYTFLLCVYWKPLRIINNLYYLYYTDRKVLKGSLIQWDEKRSPVILFSL